MLLDKPYYLIINLSPKYFFYNIHCVFICYS